VAAISEEKVIGYGARAGMRITVAGTSFLLPGNTAWKVLSEAYELRFGDPAEWSSLLFRSPEASTSKELLAVVIFLQDVIPRDEVSALQRARDEGFERIDPMLAPVLAAIDHAVSVRGNHPLLVVWSNARRSAVTAFTRGPTIWGRIAMRWELLLRERQASFPALLQLPLDQAFSNTGRQNCFDARNYYAARCRLSQRGLSVLAANILELANRWMNPAKKVLALDCDNTLWGGVIGEDGLEGLQLGQDGVGAAYADFQRAVQELARSGVLLALVSKNEEADVWRVFEKHSGMVLRRSDVAVARINWEEKSANLASIAEELGLGLDSFVFWDDNPLERERVRQEVSDVVVADAPKEIWSWPEWLDASPLFARFEVTEEDRQRTEMYRSRARFQSEQKHSQDEIGFLKSIELRVNAVAIAEDTISRAAQLSMKTNQFNLRTQRYDPPGLRQMMAEKPAPVAFLAHLRDRFGDHGNTGLVIARALEGVTSSKAAFLDTFLLSCRVLGRHVEAWMLHECARRLAESGTEILIAEFIPSERNAVAAGFLAEHGFSGSESWDSEMQSMLRPVTEKMTGQIFTARIPQISIPYLDLFSL
jgi:FkbH-like protein